MGEAVRVINEISIWAMGIPEEYFIRAFQIWVLVFVFTLGQLTYGIWENRKW